MKLARTSSISFGWLFVFPLLDVVFLLIFFFLLTRLCVTAGDRSHRAVLGFMLGPQSNSKSSASPRSQSGDLFARPKGHFAQLGPALDVVKREGRSIVIKADRLVPMIWSLRSQTRPSSAGSVSRARHYSPKVRRKVTPRRRRSAFSLERPRVADL